MGGAVRIRRLLIANRGEIAVRIARAARASGIVPLGVYSDADAHAYHLEFVDDAARLGPAPARESYLDVERVLRAARELRADAIHPGYGFLSERAHFAEAVAAAGLIFVGPPASAIAAMGDKTEAKRRAREHGVPVVPGYDGEDQSPERLEREAQSIGTPVLIKASAGGGGRGMRIVGDPAGFGEALSAAKREALAAFGDDRVLLEKYIARPRHIEFQIVADAHGTTLHLGERECSIQRRHQKVIEEAPSVALSPELRARMGEAAVRTARSVGYVNAGTVEFLLDEDGAFYFLEMNARLQVEHPVTELVHGVDLVRLQLHVAEGLPLPFNEHDVTARGWAVEARINAEDPDNDFLPAIGTIARWEPPEEPDLRLDAGVRAGSEVTIYYDSMLAKLIAYGPDRAAAIERLRAGLDAFRIDGVRTNVPLLRRIARDEAFARGETTTAFLGERAAFLQSDEGSEPTGALLLALLAGLDDGRGWRVAGVGVPLALARAGTDRVLRVVGTRRDAGGWRLEGDVAGDFRVEGSGDRIVAVSAAAERTGGRARVDASGIEVLFDGATYRFDFAPPPSLEATGGVAKGAGAGSVTAPMPGKIVSVAVKAGDVVAERDLLIVLEAMKMEHRIEAARAGTVANVAVAAGTLVAGGATLLDIE
jgi:3-methylcrotonyl-CoA carboxylase alpha subunit